MIGLDSPRGPTHSILPALVAVGRRLFAAPPHQVSSARRLADLSDHPLNAARPRARPARRRHFSRGGKCIWRYALMLLFTLSYAPRALSQAETTSPSTAPAVSSPFGLPAAIPPVSSGFGLPSAIPSLLPGSVPPSASPSSLPGSVLPSATPSFLPGSLSTT